MKNLSMPFSFFQYQQLSKMFMPTDFLNLLKTVQNCNILGFFYSKSVISLNSNSSLWFRNQATRWVYCYHQTSTFSGLVHPQLLLGLDQCMVNPFPERMYRFGSSGWPTSNLLKWCGAPPVLWRHCILPELRPNAQHKNTTMSIYSPLLQQSVMWNLFDIKQTAVGV